MKLKRAWYNFVCSVFSQVVMISMGLIIPRLTIVGYGSETNGILNSINQIIVYLNLLETGIQATALRELYGPIKLGNKQKVLGILSAVNRDYKKIGKMYLFGLLTLAILFPSFAKTQHSYIEVFCLVLFSGLGNVILFFVHGKYSILLQAEGKSYILTNIQTTISIVTNVAKIYLLARGINVVIIVALSFAISLAQVLYLKYYTSKKYGWIDLGVPPDHKALRKKNAVLVHQIAMLIFHNTDVLILTVMCGYKVVSIYSVYKLIVRHIYSILNIPFNSISFILGQKYNTEKDQYPLLIDGVEAVYSTGVFAVYAVVSCLLIPFVRLYTGGITDAAYVDCKLAFLFVVIELLSFIRIPMLNTINYAGHFKETLPQTITESVINLAVSLLGVMKYGIYGVLLGTIAALLYRTIDIIVYANIRILYRSAWKTFGIYSLNLLLLVAFVWMFYMEDVSIGNYLEFTITGVKLMLESCALFVPINLVAHKKDIQRLASELKIKICTNKNL